MEERDTSLCKKCHQLKIRVHRGYFVSGDKKIVDDLGRLWNGRTCPDCKLQDCKFIMAKTRVRKKAAKNEAE